MADRSVRVVLSAIIAPYQAAMGKAVASTRAMEVQLGRTSAAGKATQGALGAMGKGSMLAMSGAALGAYGLVKGLASVTNAAIDFESSFAGIRKTVDATEEEFQVLEEGMRNLATEIPVSVNELNRIGELGGQLGIAKENLVEFTAVIAKMGVTTNIAVEDAAMKFAQFAAVTGMPESQFENLASSVVHLGNKFETTEADIVEYASRLAGAGEVAGLTEADILGIGTATASIGVQAEAGGSAVQKVLLEINKSVITSDEKLKLFAKTAGMTSDQFSKAWERNAAKAFTAFVEGLGAAGADAQLVLTDLGLTDRRLTQAFLGLAGAGGKVERAVRLSNEAFEDANALQEEAAKRFETTEQKVLLAKNQIEDLKIEMGEASAVFLGDLAQSWVDHMKANDRYNDSLNSTITLLTQLGHGNDIGATSVEKFISTTIANLPLLEKRLSEAPETIGALRRELELMVADIESDTLFERFGNYGRAEAGEMELDQAEAVLELVKAMDEGTPVAKAFGEILGITGDETKKSGRDMKDGADEAVRGFDKLFKKSGEFRKWREGVVGALGDLSGAFSELGTQSNVTAAELIAAQQKQIEAVRDFKENLNVLISRGAKPQLIQDLIDMGDEGAVYAQALANANEETTKAFMQGRRESERELLGLTSAVQKADRNIGQSLDNVGKNTKKNTASWSDWERKSISSVKNVSDELAALWRLVEKGVTSPGTIRAENTGGPTVAGVFGGSALAMGDALMGRFPGLQRTSAYRPNDPGFHGDRSNPAGDYAMSGWPSDTSGIYSPEAGAISMAAISMFGDRIRELIYGNLIYERGRMGYYTANDHWGHIHMADDGGEFRGPGLVGIGNIREVVFQPAERLGPAPSMSGDGAVAPLFLEMHVAGQVLRREVRVHDRRASIRLTA